jgi:hypothetical protein
MRLKANVNLSGLHLSMRPVLVAAEAIWKQLGITEGVTVTSALDGLHSAGSLHYYGRALDFRIRYFKNNAECEAADLLKKALSEDYDVILHKTHIHVEYDLKE